MRLVPHRSTPLPADWRLTADCDVGASTVTVVWTLQADLELLRLPPPGRAARRDGLWRRTCFELFVADPSGTGYREFNFSPSSEWAAYAFDSYRAGMRAIALPEDPRIARTVSAGALELAATLPRAALRGAAAAQAAHHRCAIAAVLERADGGLVYLALAHPRGPPDFHDRHGFAVELEF